MRKIYYFALLLCASILNLHVAHASHSAIHNYSITIFTEQYPPYNYGSEGNVIGINAEIIRLACERARIECTFEILPWSRAYKLTQNNILSGLFSTSRSPDRESLFQWVGPLVNSTTMVYRLSNRNDIRITKPNHLKYYTIGVLREDVYLGILAEHGFVMGKNMLDFSDRNQMTKLLRNQKIDLIIGSDLTLPYQVKSMNLDVKDLVPVIELPLPSLKGNYLALNKNFPSEIKLLLEQEIMKIMTLGKANTIVQKYRSEQIN